MSFTEIRKGEGKQLWGRRQKSGPWFGHTGFCPARTPTGYAPWADGYVNLEFREAVWDMDTNSDTA